MTDRTTCSIRPAASACRRASRPRRRCRAAASSTPARQIDGSFYLPGSRHRHRRRADAAGHHLRREPRPDRAVAALLCRRRRLGARLRLPGAGPARPGVRRSDRRPQPHRIRARGAGAGRRFRDRAVRRCRQHLDLAAAAASTTCSFGAGIGVRYHTRFGPIRVDVGTPLNPRSGDPAGRRLRLARPGLLMGEAVLEPRGAGAGAALGLAEPDRQVRHRRADRPRARARRLGRLPRHRRRPPLHRRPDRGDDSANRACASASAGSTARSGGGPSCATSGSTIPTACSPNRPRSRWTGGRSTSCGTASSSTSSNPTSSSSTGCPS